MSESVTISQEVDVEVQIDSVECEKCGKKLDFSMQVDYYGEVYILVDPHACGEEDDA